MSKSTNQSKPHKYANDLPLFPHFEIFVPINMMVEMMFMCIRDVFGILKHMLMMMPGCNVVYMWHIAGLTLGKLPRAVHGCRSSPFVM